MRTSRRKRLTHRRRLRGTAGFTLVELLVSVVILGIGLVALLQLYLAAMMTYQKGHYLSLATQRAQQELEIVHNLGYGGLMTDPLIDDARYPAATYTALESGRGVSFNVPALPARSDAADPAQGGRGTVTITPYTDGETVTPNVAQVVIEIVWGGIPLEQSKVTVTTLKTGAFTGGGE